MIINLTNSLTQQQGIQQTYLSGTIGAGATTAPVKNISGFNSQWAVQIGQTGEETAEVLVLSGAPSGTILPFGASAGNPGGTVKFAHSLDTPIYQVHYDQLVLFRSTAGTVGPFSAYATVSIQPDNQYTQYDDTTGLSTYAYYAQYYNSVTGDLSGTSSIFLPGGPTYYSLAKLRQRIKDKLYSAGYIRDDSLITDWVNEYYEDMTNAAIKVNQGYLMGTAAYSFGTAGLGTITDSFFKQAIKAEVTYDGQFYIPSAEIPFYDFSEDDYFSPSSPKHTWTGENTFEILPHNQAGTVKFTYSKRFTPLVNDSDELTQTLKAYTTACVEYCLSVAYGLDQKDAESQQHYQMYQQMKASFISDVTPRDLTSIKTISLQEGISGSQEDLEADLGDFNW